MERIIVAYSGGHRSSRALAAAAARPGVEVVSVTLDLGQGGDLDEVRQRARAQGAVRAHVIDAREEFARDVVLPALQAGARGANGSPLAAALARPIVAKHVVNVAAIEAAAIVAHGAAASDVGRPPFDGLVAALDPSIKVIAPCRSSARAAATAIERARGPAALVQDDDRAPSMHANLWGRSRSIVADAEPAGGRSAEDWESIVSAPASAPDFPAHVDVAFARGVPVAVNGVELPLVDLLSSLDTIASVHGVGRLELDPRAAGGAREIVEAPAAIVLHVARTALDSIVGPERVAATARDVRARYVDVIERGPWHSAARGALDAIVAETTAQMTGTIHLELFKGTCRVIGGETSAADRAPAAANDPAAEPRLSTRVFTAERGWRHI